MASNYEIFYLIIFKQDSKFFVNFLVTLSLKLTKIHRMYRISLNHEVLYEIFHEVYHKIIC